MTLKDTDDLVALHFLSNVKFQKAREILRKRGIPHDTENLMASFRLIVPNSSLRYIRGYISKCSVIYRENLLQFIQKHARFRKIKSWHASSESPVLLCILSYRYFFKDYVLSHLPLFIEAFRQIKFGVKI